MAERQVAVSFRTSLKDERFKLPEDARGPFFLPVEARSKDINYFLNSLLNLIDPEDEESDNESEDDDDKEKKRIKEGVLFDLKVGKNLIRSNLEDLCLALGGTSELELEIEYFLSWTPSDPSSLAEAPTAVLALSPLFLRHTHTHTDTDTDTQGDSSDVTPSHFAVLCTRGNLVVHKAAAAAPSASASAESASTSTSAPSHQIRIDADFPLSFLPTPSHISDKITTHSRSTTEYDGRTFVLTCSGAVHEVLFGGRSSSRQIASFSKLIAAVSSVALDEDGEFFALGLVDGSVSIHRAGPFFNLVASSESIEEADTAAEDGEDSGENSENKGDDEKSENTRAGVKRKQPSASSSFASSSFASSLGIEPSLLIPHAHQAAVTGLYFPRRGALTLASASAAGTATAERSTFAVVSVGQDGGLRVWDYLDGSKLGGVDTKAPITALSGHQQASEGVHEVSLTTGHCDGFVRHWTLKKSSGAVGGDFAFSFSLTAAVAAHARMVSGLAINGDVVACASNDGHVSLSHTCVDKLPLTLQVVPPNEKETKEFPTVPTALLWLNSKSLIVGTSQKTILRYSYE